MKVQPLFDRLVVQRGEPKNALKHGLVMPERARTKAEEGIVLQLGCGLINDHGHARGLQVKIGDKVMFNPHAGTEVQIDNQICLLLRESEVLGVLEPAETQELASI